MHHRPSSIEGELWAGHVDERPRSRPVVTQNDGCREQWSLVHTFLYTCDDHEADIVLRLIVDTNYSGSTMLISFFVSCTPWRPLRPSRLPPTIDLL